MARRRFETKGFLLSGVLYLLATLMTRHVTAAKRCLISRATSINISVGMSAPAVPSPCAGAGATFGRSAEGYRGSSLISRQKLSSPVKK
jgi:hypothetical protein